MHCSMHYTPQHSIDTHHTPPLCNTSAAASPHPPLQRSFYVHTCQLGAAFSIFVGGITVMFDLHPATALTLQAWASVVRGASYLLPHTTSTCDNHLDLRPNNYHHSAIPQYCIPFTNTPVRTLSTSVPPLSLRHPHPSTIGIAWHYIPTSGWTRPHIPEPTTLIVALTETPILPTTNPSPTPTLTLPILTPTFFLFPNPSISPIVS